jgi:hypothetical protein
MLGKKVKNIQTIKNLWKVYFNKCIKINQQYYKVPNERAFLYKISFHFIFILISLNFYLFNLIKVFIKFNLIEITIMQIFHL